MQASWEIRRFAGRHITASLAFSSWVGVPYREMSAFWLLASSTIFHKVQHLKAKRKPERRTHAFVHECTYLLYTHIHVCALTHTTDTA